MIEDLVKPSNDPARWKSCADEINNALLLVDMEAARRPASALQSDRDAEAERLKAMEPAKKAIQAYQAMSWPYNRLHYTLGQLDTGCLILCCERKLLDWQAVFNAKAAFGAAEDLERIRERAKLMNAALDLNQPLRLAAKPLLLVEGLRHEGNAETVEKLLKMGADPAIDNGQTFMNVVTEGSMDVARALAKHGQGFLDINAWVNWAKTSRKTKAYSDFRQLYWEYGRFTALDRETLMETKPLPDNAGALKIIFNFASRRVEEIHEFTNPRQNVLNAFSFEEYGEAALDSARQKLIELGGQPSDIGPTLRGKGGLIAKPAPFGRDRG